MDLSFRIDTKVDPTTRKVFAEAYFPNDAKTPMATTDAIYASHEEAQADITKVVRDAVRQHMPSVREKSSGRASGS